MFITLVTVLHIIVSVFLILVVLLQQGKSADWAGAFGGGGTQTVFGSRGAATALSKATVGAAIIFLLTSMALTVLVSRSAGTSVIRQGVQQEQAVPAQPGESPQAPGAEPATPTPQQ